MLGGLLALVFQGSARFGGMTQVWRIAAAHGRIHHWVYVHVILSTGTLFKQTAWICFKDHFYSLTMFVYCLHVCFFHILILLRWDFGTITELQDKDTNIIK